MRALSYALPFVLLALAPACSSPPSIDGQLWGCSGDQDCVAPKRCINKVCRSGCQTVCDCAHLGANAECSPRGLCIQPGGPRSGRPDVETCDAGGDEGNTGTSDAGGPLWDPGGGPEPTSCTYKSECGPGQECIDGSCVVIGGPDGGYVDDVWITPSDGGGPGWEVLPPLGQSMCNNDHDLGMLSGADLENLMAVCGYNCLYMPNDYTVCTTSCVQTETGVTPGCARCFGETLTCVRDYCAVQCAGGGPMDLCLECQREKGCLDIFVNCSGFPLDSDSDGIP